MSQQTSTKVLGIVALIALATACAQQVSSAAAGAAPAPVAVAAPLPVTPARSLVSGLPDFAGLVEAVGPAVVSVVAEERSNPAASRNNRQFGFDNNDDFNEFFRRFGITPPSGGNTPRNNVQKSEGSGFIVSSDGYILTNAHVVDGATKVTVQLNDKRSFTAKVVGADTDTDVAVLKIEGKSLPVVRLGDASKVRAGEWVVAIGSPFGFENTVTAGIVSATSRSSSRMAAAAQDGNNTRYGSFIQTDVAVNPGNSGGPLFNVNGEVIGINSQIYSGTGSYAGLSFAIPINLANSIREQLVSNGKVSRGRIGVTVGAVSPDLAESFGLDRARGAAVSTVIKDGPAAKAGIREEDVILSVNGRKIEAESELPEIVAAIKPGTKIDLEIWRDKSAKHVSVVVDEFSAGTATRTANTKSSGGGAGRAGAVEKLGLTVRTLTSSEQRQIGAEGGVYVEEVTGAAEEAGIQSGDVILSAGGKKLASAEDLRDAAKAGGVLRLRVQNESGIFLATVRPE